MSTTRQTFVHYNKTGGMDRSGRPFTTEASVWHTQFNMRSFEGKVTQVPLKKVHQYTIPYSGRTALDLTNIPSPSGSVLVSLTEDRVKRVTNTEVKELKEDGTVVELDRPGVYMRWGKTVFNDRVFFVNEVNKVRYTDGATVHTIGGTSPKGRYVEVWFDHVVIGGPIFPGEDLFNGVAWSHLHDWSNFTPDTDSEADRYVFTEYQRDYDVVPGVTGVKKLGNACIVYTASSIYQMQYTGLPRVVRVDPVVQDFGNGFKYGLVAAHNKHFFIDSISQSFFEFNGMGISNVGMPIASFFFATLTEDPVLRQRTWGYVDHKWREIWWVYVSKGSTGEFDRAVVYNYVEKRWFAASVENIHSFTTTVEDGAVAIESLTGTIDSQTATIDRLGGAEGLPLRLWGGENERLMREETTDDETTTLLAQPVPVLEGRDEVHGGIQAVKETDSITVQGLTKGEVPILIERSARANVDDPVQYKKVGLFRPKENPQIPVVKVPSRVHRWRFNPIAVGAVANDVTIYKDGVTGFQMRANVPNESWTGLYVSFQVTSPWGDCYTNVTAMVLNEVSTRDGNPGKVQLLSGPDLSSVAFGTTVEEAVIGVDTDFLGLADGPEMFEDAIEITLARYADSGGSCVLSATNVRTIDYATLRDVVNASGAAGTIGDPHIYNLSDS